MNKKVRIIVEEKTHSKVIYEMPISDDFTKEDLISLENELEECSIDKRLSILDTIKEYSYVDIDIENKPKIIERTVYGRFIEG